MDTGAKDGALVPRREAGSRPRDIEASQKSYVHEQKLSLDERHALRQERAPAILAELHAELKSMKDSDLLLPQSVEGKAIQYVLKRAGRS